MKIIPHFRPDNHKRCLPTDIFTGGEPPENSGYRGNNKDRPDCQDYFPVDGNMRHSVG